MKREGNEDGGGGREKMREEVRPIRPGAHTYIHRFAGEEGMESAAAVRPRARVPMNYGSPRENLADTSTSACFSGAGGGAAPPPPRAALQTRKFVLPRYTRSRLFSPCFKVRELGPCVVSGPRAMIVHMRFPR